MVGPCSVSGVMLKPPMRPDDAVISPSITAPEAYRYPLEEIAKLDPKCT